MSHESPSDLHSRRPAARLGCKDSCLNWTCVSPLLRLLGQVCPREVHARHTTKSTFHVTVRFETFGLNAKLLDPPKPMGRVHHHHEIEINYLIRGGVTYLYRWVRRRLPVQRLTVFWGSVPHSVIEVEPGSLMAWITIPLPWVHQWRLPREFIHSLIEGEWWSDVREENTLERYPILPWVSELATTKSGPHTALSLELEACLMRIAAETPACGRTCPSATAIVQPAAWARVESMARYIATNFATEIDVTDVASSVGLHPKYAMTLFRRLTGATVKEFLLQHRITHAQRLLLVSDDKILEVAMASGFQSLSAFYSCFTQQVHETPSHFRQRFRETTISSPSR